MYAAKMYTPYNTSEAPTLKRRIDQRKINFPEFKPVDTDCKRTEKIGAGYYNLKIEKEELSLKMQKERHRLLHELTIQLNISESKIVSVGTDVFNNFLPCVKIIKQGLNQGVCFHQMDIMQLLHQINNIIECLKTDDNYKCELKNYEINCSNGVNVARFVPKDPTDVFQLYLGLVTLENLRDMKNCIIIKLQSLICVDDTVDSFTTDVVEAVDRKGLNSASRSDMCEVLSNKYIDNLPTLGGWLGIVGAPINVQSRPVSTRFPTKYLSENPNLNLPQCQFQQKIQ
ncbi:hypothetical protein RN001_003759 [Aquatica leii]|uniref:Uncharacterized protein n=1 Tax=Aquatica leii TaxID=1421715 RepID=A0AAN7SRP9_9COLE|nr:hypothetical protein RN001_003759 [Aquatica leii]